MTQTADRSKTMYTGSWIPHENHQTGPFFIFVLLQFCGESQIKVLLRQVLGECLSFMACQVLCGYVEFSLKRWCQKLLKIIIHVITWISRLLWIFPTAIYNWFLYSKASQTNLVIWLNLNQPITTVTAAIQMQLVTINYQVSFRDRNTTWLHINLLI